LDHHNNTLSPIVDELLQYGRLADREPWDCATAATSCHFEKLRAGVSVAPCQGRLKTHPLAPVENAVLVG
jgi:hypothetical protein